MIVDKTTRLEDSNHTHRRYRILSTQRRSHWQRGFGRVKAHMVGIRTVSSDVIFMAWHPVRPNRPSRTIDGFFVKRQRWVNVVCASARCVILLARHGMQKEQVNKQEPNHFDQNCQFGRSSYLIEQWKMKKNELCQYFEPWLDVCWTSKGGKSVLQTYRRLRYALRLVAEASPMFIDDCCLLMTHNMPYFNKVM